LLPCTGHLAFSRPCAADIDAGAVHLITGDRLALLHDDRRISAIKAGVDDKRVVGENESQDSASPLSFVEAEAI
jgi:hypothetical protein